MTINFSKVAFMGLGTSFLLVCTVGSTTTDPITPEIPLKSMKDTDACLFACYLCYDLELIGGNSHYARNEATFSSENSVYEKVPSKNMLMMHCINQLCLADLMTGKPLDAFWRITCPKLRIPFRHSNYDY